jgi:hypothetical protein
VVPTDRSEFCQTTADALVDLVGDRLVMEEPQRVLADRYRLADPIGRGGMADVYSAEDTLSGRMVAVKVMRVGEQADPDRFAAEMAILDRLEHPAIVRLYDTGRTAEDSPYFVMQLIEGESMSVRLREEGALPEGDIVKIAARIAGALEHAHQRGVVHRDIKPANILIDERGRGYLTDFGVARLVDATMVTRTGTTIGTAAYLAPEQLQDSAVGPSADVYSLGLVLIEAFTGRRAFTGTGVEAAMARLGRDPGLPDDLPDNWMGLLLAMTRRDPDRRPTAGFVEGVLRGRIPPPPLDPAEFAARHAAAAGDDAPTAITPMTGERTPSSWEPPSGGSGSTPAPPTPPPAPPPGAPPPAAAAPAGSAPSHAQPAVHPAAGAAASAAPGSPAGSGAAPAGAAVDAAGPDPAPPAAAPDDRRPLLIVIAVGTIALGALISLLVFTLGGILGSDQGDPVVGEDPVDDAAREVLRVLDATEALRASDPSLQRPLRLLADDMVVAVNDSQWEAALLATLDMTNEVRAGIERLDIEDVALRPLLDALQMLTTALEAEVAAEDTG